MSASSKIRIAIVGAGPAGLALARILLRKPPSLSTKPPVPFTVTVFDRDNSPLNPIHRPQGGSLDLHADSGQLGIQEANVWDAFVAKAHYEAQGWRVDDRLGQTAAEVSEEAGKDRNKPEIGRAELRNVLAHDIEALSGVTVCWGLKVMRVEFLQSKFRLHFEGKDNKSDESCLFDVVVGADGTWSQVRSILDATVPRYSGMTIIETSIDPTHISSTTASKVGNGSYMVLGARQALMAQRNSDGRIRVYIALTLPDTWAKENTLDWSDAAQTKETILDQYFGDWSRTVKNLVYESGSNELRVWPLYETPKPSEGGQWKSKLAVTLIGDAAHVMPPWTGRGVNMALLDSVELGRKMSAALSQGLNREEMVQALTKSIREYEEEMWTRMDKEKTENLQSQMLLFAEDSPKTFQEAMKSETLVQT